MKRIVINDNEGTHTFGERESIAYWRRLIHKLLVNSEPTIGGPTSANLSVHIVPKYRKK